MPTVTASSATTRGNRGLLEDCRILADVAVSGADPIESREGFARLLDRIDGNGVRVVIIEGASRLARQLVTQELAILALTSMSAGSNWGMARRSRYDRQPLLGS
jgi:Resolvase, N terminal domain